MTAPHLRGDVLLVEDDLRDKELIVRALTKAGYDRGLVVCRDGREALDHLLGAAHAPARRALPRVVLLDLKLPRVDGFEVLEAIRGDSRTTHLPVVVLTSSQEESDIERAYRMGANSFVVKPVGLQAIGSMVSEIGRYWLVHNEVGTF
ncbi:MAG: response regulator [Planctomycetes bacterium]|nr:response regulator [Planctomycetota bacterium]MCB9891822.1 response regulator [Planctomycetota bacterium]